MTREENLHWIDQEIQTWENECQSKHPIKEALPSIEEKIVIQETEWVKDGQVVVVERETFEKWVNHYFDYKAESEG